MCGHTPAAKVTFQSTFGLVIWFSMTAFSGYYCRACAVALFRDQTARNLIGLWWGVLSLPTGPIFLALNLYYRGKALRLAPPSHRDPAVDTPEQRPMEPGTPVFQRPPVLGVLTLVLLAGVVGAVVAIAR